MAMTNPVGRINYEPNSATGDTRGPREDPVGGYTTFPSTEQGAKQRVRSETFADHYSQARQFLISQTPDRADPHRQRVRVRAVQGRGPGHPHPDGRQPAQRRRRASPPPSPTASASPSCPPPARRRAPRSPTCRLGRVEHPQQRTGELRRPQGRRPRHRRHRRRRCSPPCSRRVDAEGAVLELIAPKIGGVTLSDGSLVPADQNVDGGPSVLYDAVAVLAVRRRRRRCSPLDAAAKDFVTDAHAHCKFIGHVARRRRAASGRRPRRPDRRRLRRPRRRRRRRLHRRLPPRPVLGARTGCRST